jgi:hypothetical protein
MKQKAANGDGSQQELVRMFRILTEAQFDFWLGSLNDAARAMGSKARKFDSDDRQKTISYWYLLMFLLEIYAASRNPFDVRESERWLSDGLVSMKVLMRSFRGRFKQDTVRRYVFDLKQRGLIALDGRGPNGMVQLSAPAILALANTVREWVKNFREVDERIRKMDTF